MSKLITQLLEAKEPLFSITLKQLEQASGNQGVDVALTAEIIEKKNDRMKKLGLDPKDTTGKELYLALEQKVKEHDGNLVKQLGGTDPEAVHDMIPKCIEYARSADVPKKCWVMKTDVAAGFLRETPPQAIIDKLGHSNIDELLEKEDIFEIFGALRFAQDGEWLNEFNEHYKRLTPDDFEEREIQLVEMSADKWGDIAPKFIEKKMHNITHSKEMGVIIALPMHIDRMPAITTKTLSLLMHYFNEVRLYSAFFKLQQVKPNFGEIIVDTLIADPGNAAIMAGQNVHWRVIQRYFGKLKDEYHPEIFEPHVHPEDLHWRKAEEALYQIDPELEFWDGLDYVGDVYEDGKPVTFNMMDVSFGFSNGISYEDRYFYHFRNALWNEIFMRYMGKEILEDQILKQLDNDLIAPENLAKD